MLSFLTKYDTRLKHFDLNKLFAKTQYFSGHHCHSNTDNKLMII